MIRAQVQQIYDSGMPESEIAERCGSTQPTINRLRTGKTVDPKTSLSDAVRALHAELVAQGRIEPENAAAGVQ